MLPGPRLRWQRRTLMLSGGRLADGLEEDSRHSSSLSAPIGNLRTGSSITLDSVGDLVEARQSQ